MKELRFREEEFFWVIYGLVVESLNLSWRYRDVWVVGFVGEIFFGFLGFFWDS